MDERENYWKYVAVIVWNIFVSTIIVYIKVLLWLNR